MLNVWRESGQFARTPEGVNEKEATTKHTKGTKATCSHTASIAVTFEKGFNQPGVKNVPRELFPLKLQYFVYFVCFVVTSREMTKMLDQQTKVRLDKWLWAARFYKTRALAVDAIETGKIEVNAERSKRSKLVQPGDRIRIRMGPYEHLITVKGVSDKRGSAPIAAQLYEEDAESKKARDAMAAHVRAMRASTGYESGRPTKKDRRDIERLRRR